MPTCPTCDSRSVRPARFSWGDVIRALLLLSPFRCRDCGERFYALPVPAESVGPRGPLRMA